MTNRETSLLLAAFLESAPARSLQNIEAESLRRVARLFLECCFDGLGKSPKHLDGDDVHGLLLHLLPEKMAKKDPDARHVLPIARAILQFTEDRAVVSQSYEIARALEENNRTFLDMIERGESHSHGHGHSHGGSPEKPFVHKAEKTGRNDPCPCGSGRKFKQCCMKLGA
ncbi:MAG: SEC-C domain-containing protein [Planctomycetes bacterium]|nr:SEC-C domain-containing protein [Planctomycetota bacterium]